MNVASKELSIDLYKLSGWETGEWIDPFDNTVMNQDDRDIIEHDNDGKGNTYPAYDLGYLLRKIQPYHIAVKYVDGQREDGEIGYYTAFNWDTRTDYTDADTPEDALCSLAIQLIKEGVLK